MGRDSMSIGVQIRNFMAFSFRLCFRSVCSHPFLVGMLCFWIFLYRSFPFLFSLLVSVSPILVCTAVLLGTILSFGQPNIPEIETEDDVRLTHDFVSLRVGVSEDDTVVEKSESFSVERCLGKRRDIVDEVVEEASLTGIESSKIEQGEDSLSDNAHKFQCEKVVIEEVERGFDDLELILKRGDKTYKEEPGIEGVASNQSGELNQYYLVEEVGEDESCDVENGTLSRESVDDQAGDGVDSSPGSWRPEENDDEDDSESESESESDRAESSSPDASMADIHQMLDELHPLLDLEAPQNAHMLSRDGSDAASEHSHGSSDGSVESDEDSENEGGVQREEEDGEEDQDEDEEEEEEEQGSKDDVSKSAITWTEDDQKNLMDLGTLELERNQRLESLIARRLARKSFRLMDEKNLIDLESFDLPFKVPPISTARRNPFDSPGDSYDNMGLPPIPGSAPSILLPRRNPFDLPYDPNEEKPDLKGDSFQEEFMPLHPHKETSFFRRHESFSLGPSTLGGAKQERQDTRWRPYFVPEWFTSEGTSHPSFHRQLSNESKASSIPDTDSDSSADPSIHRQLSEVSLADPSSHRQLSDVSEYKVSSIHDTESVTSATDPDNKKLSREYSSKKIELIFDIDHASDHVEHRSQSSDDVESVDIEHIERRDIICDEVELTSGGFENHHEIDPCSSEAGGTSALVEVDSSEILVKSEHVEHENSGSRSSFSELNVMINDVKKEPQDNDTIEEFGISKQPSFEEPDFNFPRGVVDDNQHKDPVYDSSPPKGEKILSFSSISSDLLVQVSEMGLPSPPMSIETDVPFTDKESEMHLKSIEIDNSDTEQMRASSSQVREVDENKSRLRDVVEIIELSTVTVIAPSGVDLNVSNRDGTVVPLPVDDHISVISDLLTSDDGPVEHSMMHEDESHHEQDLVHSSSSDEEIDTQRDVEKFDLSSSSHQKPSEDLTLSVPEEQRSSIGVEHVPAAAPYISVTETEPVEIHTIDKEEMLHFEHDQVHSSNSSENGSIEEGMMYEDQSFPHVQDQVHLSSFDTEIDVGDRLDSVMFSYQSEDMALSAPEELQDSLVVEQVSRVLPNLASPGTENVEEHSLIEEETLQFEHDHISSSSDEKIDTILHKDFDAELVSSVPLEENSPSEFEKQLAWADKSVLEPSFDDHQELQTLDETNINCGDTTHGSSVIRTGSMEEVGITNEEAVPDTDDPEDRVSPDLSSLPPHYTTIESDSGVIDLNNILLNDMENISGEDGIKEIDETLLSELDTVGDFRIKEVVGQSLHEAMINKDMNLVEMNSERPLPEARPIEDIGVGFKKLHGGADVKEVIRTSSSEDQSDTDESTVKTNPSFPVIEARPLEDIQSGLLQQSEFKLSELPTESDTKDASADIEANEVRSVKETESISPRSQETGTISISKEIESNSLESGIPETSPVAVSKENESNNMESVQKSDTGTSDQPQHELNTTSESSGPNKSDAKGKKERSHNTSSSSSSSSSDSD